MKENKFQGNNLAVKEQITDEEIKDVGKPINTQQKAVRVSQQTESLIQEKLFTTSF
jgi:hypothetical protein